MGRVPIPIKSGGLTIPMYREFESYRRSNLRYHMYYTYILKSLTSGRFYIGQTDNLELRLARHNDNTVKSTKNRGPWEVIYFEEYDNRSEAMIREKYLKSLKSRRSIEELISRNITNSEKAQSAEA